MDTQLHLAVDAAAAFRRVGDGVNPSTVSVALLAELAGANAIAYDMRGPDRGEAEKDGKLLRACLTGTLDVVSSAGPDLMDIAFALRPDRITLAPERREGGMGTGGIDAQMLKDALETAGAAFERRRYGSWRQVEPELEQCKALHRSEVDVAVLDSGAYLRARGKPRK